MQLLSKFLPILSEIYTFLPFMAINNWFLSWIWHLLFKIKMRSSCSYRSWTQDFHILDSGAVFNTSFYSQTNFQGQHKVQISVVNTPDIRRLENSKCLIYTCQLFLLKDMRYLSWECKDFQRNTALSKDIRICPKAYKDIQRFRKNCSKYFRSSQKNGYVPVSFLQKSVISGNISSISQSTWTFLW